MDITANQAVNIDLDFTKFEFPFDNLGKLAFYSFKLINVSNINTNVTYLIFGNVSWTSIQSYYFTNLIKLKILHIYRNNIRIIHNYIFKGLIYLNDLELNNNNITYIEAGAFYGLVRLQYLKLDNNALVELNMDTFNIYNKMVIFEQISFQKNPIKSIKSGIFISTKKIYLPKNNIDIIIINAFNVKLKIYMIHSTIVQNLFGKLKKLKTDTILNNTIMCNCNTFNLNYNHSILKLMNISIHYYIGCLQLENVAISCTNTKGKYIYKYYYAYTVIYINVNKYIYIRSVYIYIMSF